MCSYNTYCQCNFSQRKHYIFRGPWLLCQMLDNNYFWISVMQFKLSSGVEASLHYCILMDLLQHAKTMCRTSPEKKIVPVAISVLLCSVFLKNWILNYSFSVLVHLDAHKSPWQFIKAYSLCVLMCWQKLLLTFGQRLLTLSTPKSKLKNVHKNACKENAHICMTTHPPNKKHTPS